MKNIIYRLSYILILYTLFRNLYEVITSVQIYGSFSSILTIKCIIILLSFISLIMYFFNTNTFDRLSIAILVLEPIIRIFNSAKFYYSVNIIDNAMIINAIIFFFYLFFYCL